MTKDEQPTPRTDAEQRELFVLFDTVSGENQYVSAEFARQLERELSAAQERCANLQAGQELLRQQTVRIRHAALGVSRVEDDRAEGVDTEELVKRLRGALEECVQHFDTAARVRARKALAALAATRKDSDG